MNERYLHRIGALPQERGLWRAYVIGYVLSITCTLVAFFLVVNSVFSPALLLATIALLACVQCFVQGVFFLHLGWDIHSRPKLLILGFAILVVTILVSGSLWIMYNLSGRMTPDAAQMEQYMNDQGGF